MHIHSRIQFENTQHFSITYTFSKKPPVPDWRSVAHSNQILFSKLFVEKINQASFDSWRCIYIRSLYTRIVGALCSRYTLKREEMTLHKTHVGQTRCIESFLNKKEKSTTVESRYVYGEYRNRAGAKCRAVSSGLVMLCCVE